MREVRDEEFLKAGGSWDQIMTFGDFHAIADEMISLAEHFAELGDLESKKVIHCLLEKWLERHLFDIGHTNPSFNHLVTQQQRELATRENSYITDWLRENLPQS
jgi:hypothetical protein